jgi:hypothetical protein
MGDSEAAETGNMTSMHHPITLAVDDRYEIRINHFLFAKNNHIFNEPAYFKLHATAPGDLYAQLVRRSDNKVGATIAFYEEADHVFTSPRRGSFGGLGGNEALELPAIESFLRTLFDHLKATGAREIRLKCPPISHDLPLSSIVANVMLRGGASLASFEINQDMVIDTRSFRERVGYGNRKRIQKCLREGFFAAELDLDAFERAYELIRDNRDRRHYPMTMTAEQLRAMFYAFPQRLRIFAVHSESEQPRMLAASICIELSPSVLYVFYWADAAGMESHSPVALLASCIYEFGQRRGFRVLDVGTSTVAGEPNQGLMRFKRDLGFSESLKPSYCLRM